MNSIRRAASLGARQTWLWRNRGAFAVAAVSAQPRLLLDVSAIIRHDAQTGIQRVVRAVWSEFRRRDLRGFELAPVYATPSHGYCYAPLDFLDRKERRLPCEPVSARPGDKFLGLDLAAHLLPKYRRQLEAWQAQGASVHLIVYDLLPLLRPDWFSRTTARNFRNWFDLIVRHADQAICISEQVARDLRSRIPDRNAKPTIGRLQMGGDIAASMPSRGIPPEVDRLLERIRFRPAILMVGTIEPRKGYDVALAAFEHLWRTRPADAPDLVIVGKPGWKTEVLQNALRSHPQRGERLHWLERASDEALCLLYEACCALFVASRGEGFGLPLIEATLHGRNVLARDLPVFREQRLPNVSYFSDDRPASLGEQLLQMAKTRGNGPAAAERLPNWTECVDGLLVEIGLTTNERSLERPLRKAS